LFEEALERDPGDALQWVARQTPDDSAVRDEVRSLLEHHSRAGEFLVRPAAEQLGALLDEPLPAGTSVGPYEILQELGRGGMGRVYLANDRRLNRRLALKALAPQLTSDPLQRERLRREARAAAAVRHPGICTVFALEEIGDELYIAEEFVDGHTLGQEIRERGLPTEGQIVQTATELAAALAAAHAAGIVHRDLKPENVMRASDGRLKVLDFGLARSQVESASIGQFATRPGALVGTPGYIAPEQLAGERGDARADVYAFGILMYEYATGKAPFATGAPRRVPAIAGVVERCLRLSPDERFQDAGEIRAALTTAARMSSAAWWRTHQFVIVALYIVGSVAAWQIKEWMETPVTVAIFLSLGAAATIGGVLRGHLVFTERVNSQGLDRERRRARRSMRFVDVVFAILLFADGVLIGRVRALPGVFGVSLALIIASAALVLEPATNRATFGDRE
jgi:hypothetical protein